VAADPPGAGKPSDHVAARKIRLLMELRREGIKDTRVLAALERVPRERFVSPAFQDQAYANRALPIASGQTVSQPYVVALMTEAARIGPADRVLEIGTGSGYQAAVLAELAGEVYSIERHAELLAEAQRVLQGLGYANLHTRVGDGMAGWPEAAPFDAILVTAAAEEVPQALAAQLKEGGRLILPLGRHQGAQRLLRLTRRGAALEEEELCEVRFVPLLPGLPRL
jgi:protein-L-isoaspartate(D-aspartate) O-methyltransferase